MNANSTTSDTAHLALLLLGNSRNEGQEFLGHAVAEVESLFAECRTILLVPYANPPGSGAVDNARRLMAAVGKQSVVAMESRDVLGQLHHCDGVFIQGGNTWRLLFQLYEQALIAPLRSRALEGMPILGTSAGSNVMCPTIATTNDMAINEVPSLRSLALIPFQINAHYVSSEFYIDDFTGESREQRLEEYVEATGRPVLALPEGSGVRVRGFNFSLTGAKPAVLFTSNPGLQTTVAPGAFSPETELLLGIR